MPQNYELVLTGFRFPRKLSPSRANFRFVADLRYVNGRGEHATEHAILPDLDRWWECDRQKKSHPGYVRGPDVGGLSSFDMERIDLWDRLILLVRGDEVHSIQFKVFDVNRPDAWDRLRRALGDIVRTLVGKARAVLPEVAGLFSDSLGSAATDLESAVITRLAGGERLLFRGSARLAEPGAYEIDGAGESGRYALGFTLEVS